MPSLRIVIDANIAIAALLAPDGWTAKQVGRRDLEPVAPVFLWDEIEAHDKMLRTKAGCTRQAWSKRLARFRRRIRVIPEAELVPHAEHPLVRAAEAIDPADAPYLAALIASEAHLLWTRDRALLDALPGLAVMVVPDPTTE